jgi:argininosuccinate lyase
VSRNSLDAVSDRDFAVEFTGACSIIMTHLSRLAEDLIIYNSAEFGLVELSDAVASGSSLMPQKKNPDGLELIRGKAGRVFGDHIALLTMLKGTPLAYNKDLQEDKEAVFDSFDTVDICLRAAAAVLAGTKLNEVRASAAATSGWLNATELADHLVKHGVAFRDAHELTGRMVLYAISHGKELNELSLAELRRFSKKINADVFDDLSLERTVASKNTVGGTAPARVKKALRDAKRYLRK